MSAPNPAHVIDHPLVKHHLTRIRAAETGHELFRLAAQRLTTLMVLEATRGLNLVEKNVSTPLCEMQGQALKESIALVPILRAGLGMLEPVLDLIPAAQVWHLGLYRDEQTTRPVEYYNNLPQDRATDVAYILDPMLATGGSAGLACQTLLEWGVGQIRLLSLIAAPEGLATLNRDFPDLEIFVCAIDEHLDERKFIVPGLGDAGDRIFNTELS